MKTAMLPSVSDSKAGIRLHDQTISEVDFHAGLR